MKQWILSFLLVLLVACGGETAVNEAAVPTSPPIQAEVTVPPPPATATLPPPVIQEGGEVDKGENQVGGGGDETAGEGGEQGFVAEATAEPVMPSGPWPNDQFGYGVQVHGNATVGNPDEIMGAVRNQLGMNWVKVQMQWYVVERSDRDQWFFYDAVIENAHKHGLRLLLSVVAAP